MTKRDVIRLVLEGKKPPYVPWSMGFTQEAKEKLQRHYGCDDLEGAAGQPPAEARQRHRLLHRPGQRPRARRLRRGLGPQRRQGHRQRRGLRAARADAGRLRVPRPAATAASSPTSPRRSRGSPTASASSRSASRSTSGRGRCAGMENLMMDFHDHPEFVHELLERDRRLQHRPGPRGAEVRHRRRLLRRRLGPAARPADGPAAVARVHLSACCSGCTARSATAGKFVMIHSCGDVDELFDDLIAIGLNCFNPFQPEVMDVVRAAAAVPRPAGLPRRAVDAADAALRHGRRRARARRGGCWSWAATAATSSPRPTTSKGDVPLENMLAFIEIVQAQAGYRRPH